MTQADSVHSTPPTNAPISETHPVDTPSRRRFLSQAAGVAAGGAVLALAAIPPATAANAPASLLDSAFALIAKKRAADIAHIKAIEHTDTFPVGDHSDACLDAWAAQEEACDYAHNVDWEFATTKPTTIAGVAAMLRFANELEDAGDEWPNSDAIGADGWHYQLRKTMAAAIEDIIHQNASV